MKLLRYFTLLELLYFAYGMIWLHWSVQATIGYLILSLFIYFPFGFVYIFLAEGKHRTKACVKHFFFYGFGIGAWAFIGLIAISMMKGQNWDSGDSIDAIWNSIKVFTLISCMRHVGNIILEKSFHYTRSVTEAFYIGIWKLLFMFAVMWPTIFVIIIVNQAVGEIIAYVIVAVYAYWEIKGFGR